MHPTLARFLDFQKALETMRKADAGSTLDADETAFLDALGRKPQSMRVINAEKQRKQPSNEAQNHLIVIATEAATTRLLVDPRLGPRITAAAHALAQEGASDEEARNLIAQAVLEEAFGYADDPTTFDADFLEETLLSLSHLAKVSEDIVETWTEDFAKSQGPALKALRLMVAEALFQAAWSEGPEPITPEHLDKALDVLMSSVAHADFERAAAQMAELIEFLSGKQVIGAGRKERLLHVLRTAGAPDDDSGDDDDEPSDDTETTDEDE